MTGFTAELTGNGQQRLAPFGVEVLHEGGIQASPMTIQPVSGIMPEGYVDPYFLLRVIHARIV